LIYCVVPEALADELFEKLERYYADDPGVAVIMDRRRTARRQHGCTRGGDRALRDRRRRRVAGEFPEIHSG